MEIFTVVLLTVMDVSTTHKMINLPIAVGCGDKSVFLQRISKGLSINADLLISHKRYHRFKDVN